MQVRYNGRRVRDEKVSCPHCGTNKMLRILLDGGRMGRVAMEHICPVKGETVYFEVPVLTREEMWGAP